MRRFSCLSTVLFAAALLWGCVRRENPLAPGFVLPAGNSTVCGERFEPMIVDEVLIPQVVSEDAGVTGVVFPNEGLIYYQGSGPGDVRPRCGLYSMQTVRRYMAVSGTAVPRAVKDTTRRYHSVDFFTRHVAADALMRTFSIPVDSTDRFSGYLYFTRPGIHRVTVSRKWETSLYPRRGLLKSIADSGAVTMVFYVDVKEPVPERFVHLLPSRYIDCGSRGIRNTAKALTAGMTSDSAVADTILRFLVYGDHHGGFEYVSYDSIFPGFDGDVNGPFIASEFLRRRRGVCNDFAELYAALARAAGLKVTVVSGTDPRSGTGHMWNKVCIDGAWCRLDATFANARPGMLEAYAEFIDRFWAVRFEAEHELKYTESINERY